MALISTAIYIVYPTAINWSSLSLPPWVRLLDGVFALLGFALMQGAQNALRRNWSDQLRIIEDQRLIITGPYRWFRHPMYTAFLLILGSTLLISANWFVGGLWILMTSLDAFSRIRYEEAKLLYTFGDEYRSYQESTGLLLPRF